MHDQQRTLLLVIVAFFLPPLAVAIHGGLSIHFWISVILTLLGWLPGIVHALVVLLMGKPDGTDKYL